MNRFLSTMLLLLFFCCTICSVVDAQTTREKTNTRLFWQDAETQKLSYGDLVTTDKWSLKRGWVKDFPKLDPEKQSLGPMRNINEVLLVGIQTAENAAQQRGWVGIDSGVFQQPHGNHFHWMYTTAPKTSQKMLDAKLGNPSGLFVFENNFFLSDENGISRVTAASLKIAGTTTNAPRIFEAGGADRSLATVNNSICYATWSDKDGDNAGRVDVVNLLNPASSKPAYSFKLPTGNISAAIANNGKVFFAHDNAISWLNADTSFSQNADSVQISSLTRPGEPELDLSSPPQSLVNERNWVLFTTGQGDSSAFCMVDSASQNPRVLKLPIKVAAGLRLTPPATVLSLGKRYAFVFHDRIDPDSDVPEQLTVVELDPNRDFSFADAQVKTTIPVGASKADGTNGQHRVCFDAFGRFAIFTSPGDSRLTVMTLHDLQVRVRFNVGGVPTRIVAVGAPEHFH